MRLQQDSTDMAVQQPSCCGEQTIRHAGKKTLSHMHSITFCREPPALSGKSDVSQDRAPRAPAVLKSNQAGIFNLGATEIKFLVPLHLAVLNCSSSPKDPS